MVLGPVVVPTVAEFAGASFHENGRITMVWPGGAAFAQAGGEDPEIGGAFAGGTEAIRARVQGSAA